MLLRGTATALDRDPRDALVLGRWWVGSRGRRRHGCSAGTVERDRSRSKRGWLARSSGGRIDVSDEPIHLASLAASPDGVHLDRHARGTGQRCGPEHEARDRRDPGRHHCRDCWSASVRAVLLGSAESIDTPNGVSSNVRLQPMKLRLQAIGSSTIGACAECCFRTCSCAWHSQAAAKAPSLTLQVRRQLLRPLRQHPLRRPRRRQLRPLELARSRPQPMRC